MNARISARLVRASLLALLSALPAGIALAAAEPYTVDRSWQAAFSSRSRALASNGSPENEKADWCCDSHGNRSGTRSATTNGLRTAAEEPQFRWRWEKIIGPGDHPWSTPWHSTQSGPFCDHTGEGKFCGCSNTSACGQCDSGQEIAATPGSNS